MNWSLTLGRVAGIAVRVHVTFLILLAWVGFDAYRHGEGLGEILSSIAFVLTVFVIVVLHELGHALVARAFGVKTKDIVLLPIGGMARLESMPKEPKAELLIAAAGPAVNLVLAVGFGLVSLLVLPTAALSDPRVLADSFLVRLTVVNLGLAVFNLVPAFPMDGGRVLRALLASRLPWARATRIAASLGQGLALVFGLVGLFMGHPVLVFVALFVWMGAAGEANSAELETSLSGIRVHEAMIREFHVLDVHDTLEVPVKHVIEGFQADFPVLLEGKFYGVLTREALVEALSRLGPRGLTGEATAAQDDMSVGLSPDDDLVKALASMDERGLSTAVVLDEGHVVGLLTRENVAELVLVRTSLKDLRGGYADLAERGTPAQPQTP